MKTIIEYLDDLKEKTGSDNKTAIALNIERTTISNIRKRGQMSDETAIKVADLLKIEKTEVLLAATIARSHGEVKTAWENIYKLSGLASGVVTGGTIMIGGMVSLHQMTNAAINGGMCILC